MGLLQDLPMLWKNRAALGIVGDAAMTIKQDAIKSGWKTTEFWSTAGVTVLTTIGVLYPPIGLTANVAATIVGGLVALYTIARTIHKANPPQTVVITPLPTVAAPATPALPPSTPSAA